MKKTIATLIVGLSISTAAFAFGGGQHRANFDWDELDLNDSQEDRIDDIKDSFHDKFKELKKAEGKRADKRDQFIELRKDMMADIKAVLTPEQQQEAQDLMLAKAERKMNKRLRKLSRKLDLTEEQKSSLKAHMQTQLAAVNPPLDGGQPPERDHRKKLTEEFDQKMQNILSNEQLVKWDAMKEKRMKRMAKHDVDEKHRPDHSSH